MPTLAPVLEDISDLDPPAPPGSIPFGPLAPVPPPPPPALRPPVKQPSCPLQIPAEAVYGDWLNEHLRTLDAPFNWSYPVALTIFSGMRIFSDSRIRPTLYTVTIGPPEDGKSITQDRLIESLGLLGTKHIVEATPGSDRGLQLALTPPEPEPDKTGAPPVYELRCCTLVMDEARTLFSKLGIHGSALAPTLCQLWGKDQAASPVKGGMMAINARLSLMGALACHDRDEFAEFFTAETTGGLYSRMVIAPGPNGWKWSAKWQPKVVFRRPSTKPIHVPDFVYNTVEDWRDSAPEGRKRGRICEIVYRTALISASINGDTEITPACIAAAIAFGEWQERVKMVYAASFAKNDDAVITCAALDALAQAEEENEEGTDNWVKWADLIRKHHWARKFGSSNVARVKRSLIEDKLIEAEPEIKIDDETGKPSLTGRFTGRVRSC